MAFLGDFGKFFGLGSSEEVLSTAGAGVASYFGAPPSVGANIGGQIGRATSNLSGTADQPGGQSSLPTPPPRRPADLGAQESSNSGSTNFLTRSGGQMNQAGFTSLLPAITGLGRIFGSKTGQIATGVGSAVALGGGLFGGSNDKMKPLLTQSRRNKAKVRQLVNFMGIEGTADFLSQSIGNDVSPNDVVALLLRTFRNDGAYITKAQVRNLRRTTNRFKSLEKQVKEAVSMGTTRRAPVRRTVNRSTSIKI